MFYLTINFNASVVIMNYEFMNDVTKLVCKVHRIKESGLQGDNPWIEIVQFFC